MCGGEPTPDYPAEKRRHAARRFVDLVAAARISVHGNIPNDAIQNIKLKHWRGLQAESCLKAAPVLVFVVRVPGYA